ncbi:MAG: Na/Pi cotransporter family protein [Verrucomicrobia bacterium]|nr:Na/Pi cotransporter family protein [Verrucomicrobiota bacterium]
MELFSILGGLALFIFGMNNLTDGLKGCAGDSLRRILARATRNRLSGLGLGTALGFLVQSSAATVMLVGFINAGLMTLGESVPVMLGANIGTTLSMQLISFKLADYCFVAITLGVLLHIVSPQMQIKQAGKALLGFGLLFLGMSTMSAAIAPHRDAFVPLFEQINGATPGGLIRGILLATAVTGIIQSSGAMIGMSFALIQAGVITDLSGVFPILIGANIGTCATALLGSIGTHIEARRSAVSHLLFNIFGGVLAALAAPLFYRWIPLLPGDLVHQAANANMIKMAIAALIVLPFAPLHAALVRKLIPSKRMAPQPSFLDETRIPTPEQALHAAMRELQRTVNICRESLALNRALLDAPDARTVRAVFQNEKTVDAIKLAFRDYLALITSRFLSRRQAVLVQHLDRCIVEIERIGDHLKVLCKLDAKLRPYIGHAFFLSCRRQIEELYAQIGVILGNLSISLDPEHENYEAFAEKILAARADYVQKSAAAKDLITGQVGRNDLPPLLGIYLNETIMTFDKIAKHCKAIAGAQKKPFFWLKHSRLDRLADEYTEQKILKELDAGEYLDTL